MTHTLHWLPITSRVGASLLGGYLFTWGFASLVIALSLSAGSDYHESQHLAFLLAFIVYLVAFLWGFAAASLTRVWAVLAGGGALMTVAAWLLTPAV